MLDYDSRELGPWIQVSPPVVEQLVESHDDDPCGDGSNEPSFVEDVGEVHTSVVGGVSRV